MKLITKISDSNLEKLLNHADKVCKEFDKNANCKDYLLEKINAGNTTTSYFVENDQVEGMVIIEIIDKYYGNLIVHTLEEKNETKFANYIAQTKMIENNILELIQFRSNFNYRDEFLAAGLREKERIRMCQKNLNKYQTFRAFSNISFVETTKDNNEVCGEISYQAHKHRMHIECYDVYSSAEKRSEFSNELRINKHGNAIKEACLLMKLNNKYIGLIEVIHVKNFNMEMGWIMDVALLPEFQGLGYGKHLIEKSCFELYKKGYDAIGLGVTLTNTGAYNLYKNMGFEEYEYFVEIMGV